jgi:hypothetical protein
MIWHDDEIVEFEAFCGNAGTENVDEEDGIAVGLKEGFSHPGLGCDKERAEVFDDVVGVCIAGGFGHDGMRGLKPIFFVGLLWHE